MNIDDLKKGKVKPVFGNKDHIDAVKSYEKQMAFDEEQAKLNTYEVTMVFSGTNVVEIKANNRKEAEQIALDEFDSGCSNIHHVTVDSVELVEKHAKN